MPRPRNILVRAPNWAGDVVMATPGFRALRAGFPGARICVQIRGGLEPLLAGAPWFDETLTVASYHRGSLALLREGLALRARRFDLGVCLPDSFASAALMRAAGVARIVGYRRSARGALLHQAVAPLGDEASGNLVPRERHVLGLAEAVGCEPRGTHLELFVTPTEAGQAEAILSARGVTGQRPLAALAPGASYGPSKIWPPESFARVGDALADAGAQVVVVGAPGEGALARSIGEAMRSPVADLTQELSLGTLKAVLRQASVLVCNDAGARHVAVAFGVPAIVLMGPTSLAKTNMNLERVRVLSADVGCRPCYHRVCPIDHRCMTRLEPQAVVEAALPALSSDGARTWRGDGSLRPVPATAERETR